MELRYQSEDELETVIEIVQDCLCRQHFAFMAGVQIRIKISVGYNWLEMENL